MSKQLHIPDGEEVSEELPAVVEATAAYLTDQLAIAEPEAVSLAPSKQLAVKSRSEKHRKRNTSALCKARNGSEEEEEETGTVVTAKKLTKRKGQSEPVRAVVGKKKRLAGKPILNKYGLSIIILFCHVLINCMLL